MNTAFLSDLLNAIADRGRTLLGLPAPSLDPAMRAAGLAELCERLLSGRGEASGTALAREMLSIAKNRFGPDADMTSVAQLYEEWAGVSMQSPNQVKSAG